MSDTLTPDEFADYAERRAIFLALERAAIEGCGLVMLRQIVAHPFEVEPVDVALVFYFVNTKEEAAWPACDCGTFFAPDEVEEHMGDCWGPWVG